MEEKIKKVLRRVERENEKERVWIVGPEVGQILYDFVFDMVRGDGKPLACLEIGTSVGYSAIWMASALSVAKPDRAGGKLWTVESHKERFARAQENIAEAGLGDVIVQVKGHAPEVFSEDLSMPREVDFAFFDATKKEHHRYFDAVFPLMRPGGLIVVDNVISHAEEMAEFLDLVKQHPGVECELMKVGTGLLFIRKYSFVGG